jgi:hypothetical protein
MSYSFQVTKPSEVEADDAVAIELAKVVGNQPVHARDMYAALAVARDLTGLLAQDPGKDVAVQMNGSIGTDMSGNVTSVNVSVSVYLAEPA